MRKERRIVAAAEREMQRYSFLESIAESLDYAEQPEEKRRRGLGRFITISREAGAGAEDIARTLGDRLGWEVLDKKLVDMVAERYRLSRPMLEAVDETRHNWVHNTFGPVFDPKVVPREKYMTYLERVLIAAARRGDVIFVGRGARFVLPAQGGLAIRLVASERYRVKRLQQERGISEPEAQRLVHELERGRHEFVSHFFHCNVADPHHYDLVIHVERMGVEQTVELILDAQTCWESEAKQ